MQIRNTSDRFGVVAQAFHWIIVILIIVQYQMGRIAEDLPASLEKLALMSRHKSLGITILGLALLRIAWRLMNVTPAPPGSTGPVLRAAGKLTHLVLYGLIIALPVTGWLASSAANSPVSWWGWFTLPDFLSPAETLADTLGEAHEILSRSLLLVAVLHAAAAMVHQFWYRDAVFRRMLPGWPGMDP